MITIIFTLAVVGVLVYLFNAFIPMDGRFKTAINAIIGLLLFLYVVSVLFGVSVPWNVHGVR